MTEDEALAIGAKFHEFLQTGNPRIIEHYTIEQLRMAFNAISVKHRFKPWYKEIERRIQILERMKDKEQETKERRREKWFDRAVDFLLEHIWQIGTGVFGLYFVFNVVSVNTNSTNVKVSSDNTKVTLAGSPITIDNRQYVNLTVANLTVTPDNKVVLRAIAEDAVTGDTVTFAGNVKFDYLLDDDGNRLLDEDGKPILLDSDTKGH